MAGAAANKKPAAAQEAETQQVVPVKSGVPAEFMDDLVQDAGKGTSTSQADNLVPLIYILQDQSPQVLKRNPAYIEGAEAGDIWLRNAPDPITKEMDFIPVHFSKDVVEWKPRNTGGGYVARHAFLPEDNEEIDKLAARLGAQKKALDPQLPDRFTQVMPSGNELVETRYHTGFVVRDGGLLIPFVMPLSSTGHTFSKGWMFKMNQKMVNPTTKAATWASIYHIKTQERSNASGNWFMFEVDDGKWLWDFFDDKQRVADVLLACRALHQAFETGEQKPDMPEQEASATGGTARAEEHI